MKVTVLFTDCYPDGEKVRTETLDLPPAPGGDSYSDEVMDWAADHIRPHTGTGRCHGDAGYFAEVMGCDDQPFLLGREFTWGV